MSARETDVDSPPAEPVAKPDLRRERVTVRRRRSKSRHHRRVSWTARASRRGALKSVLFCVGVLLVMALGLYFGLSRQNAAPVEGSLGTPPIATAAALG